MHQIHIIYKLTLFSPDIINRRTVTTNFIHESVFSDGFMTQEVPCLFFTDDTEHKHIHTLTSFMNGGLRSCCSRLTMAAERDDDVINFCCTSQASALNLQRSYCYYDNLWGQ